MRYFKKRSFAVILFLLVGLITVGCGDTEQEKASAEEETNEKESIEDLKEMKLTLETFTYDEKQSEITAELTSNLPEEMVVDRAYLLDPDDNVLGLDQEVSTDDETISVPFEIRDNEKGDIAEGEYTLELVYSINKDTDNAGLLKEAGFGSSGKEIDKKYDKSDLVEIERESAGYDLHVMSSTLDLSDELIETITKKPEKKEKKEKKDKKKEKDEDKGAKDEKQDVEMEQEAADQSKGAFENVIAQLDESQVKSEVTEKAEQDWPGDYEMQNYQVENQMAAFHALSDLQIDEEHKEILLNEASNEWNGDYEMIKYQYENQITAHDWGESQELESDVEKQIMEDAKADWGNDTEMVQYQYENQLQAYNWIQDLELDTDVKKQILEDAKADWGTDYEMVKYQYENQIEAYNN